MKKITTLLFVLSCAFSLHLKAQFRIYGGENHDQFLGCLSCAPDDLKSIWSSYSDYGSMHKANSIWNPDGKYGSKTSNYSPFNEKAKCPPVILDKNGKSYGYFTINKKFPNRSVNGMANSICEEREEIIKDIPGYYKSLYGIKYKQ